MHIHYNNAWQVQLRIGIVGCGKVAEHHARFIKALDNAQLIAVADVNDPALLVAHRRGQLEHLLVMDDNSAPDAYWPCYQVMAAAFARGELRPER